MNQKQGTEPWARHVERELGKTPAEGWGCNPQARGAGAGPLVCRALGLLPEALATTLPLLPTLPWSNGHGREEGTGRLGSEQVI